MEGRCNITLLISSLTLMHSPPALCAGARRQGILPAQYAGTRQALKLGGGGDFLFNYFFWELLIHVHYDSTSLHSPMPTRPAQRAGTRPGGILPAQCAGTGQVPRLGGCEDFAFYNFFWELLI